MRIALDARTIYQPTRRGTGKNLIDLYIHLAIARPHWRVTAYHRMTETSPALLPQEQVEPAYMEMPGDRFYAWERFRLPLASWRGGFDLLHCPANTCPRWFPLPTLVTIHDLIPLDHPQGRPAAQLRHFQESIAYACEHAAGIICPSHYTRDRLVREFDANPQRITVNHWAADSRICHLPPALRASTLRKYQLHDSPYVIHFGASAPRKNTQRVIEAWAMLDAAIRREHKLLVVGLDDVTRQRMQSLVEKHQLKDSVRLHGFADEADLPALMSGACMLAFPSLAEGFGLPVLDAWATRTPVLTSSTTSLPEVAQDAAILVDPASTPDIAQGMHAILSDAALREELVALGTTRLKTFTWKATTQRFITAIENAAQQSFIAQAA